MMMSEGASLVVQVVTVMGMLGIPSIFALTVRCYNKCKRYTEDLTILKKAIQAQMRGNLLKEYHEHIKRGYIKEDELAQWESEYKAYHNLGENGVLDERYEKLKSLPSKL